VRDRRWSVPLLVCAWLCAILREWHDDFASNSDLDTFGDVDCGNSTVSEGCESARYSGIVLQVNIEYNNNRDVFNFNTDRVQFRYTVDHVKESEFKAYEIIPQNDTSQIQNNRHGIRIVFRQIGTFRPFRLLVPRCLYISPHV
jgi:hypothetical protein